MKNRINLIGTLGIISFISYFLAVIISPVKYPGYNWLERAVSDLSADDAPSKKLWNILATPYTLCGVSFLTILSLLLPKDTNKILRFGIITFTIMNWFSAIGYGFFPLSESDGGGKIQDVMHIVVTVVVVLLSIVSMILIIIGSLKKKNNLSLGIIAIICLILMSTSSISTFVPHSIFGLVERFSTLSITAFTAVLGIYTIMGKFRISENSYLSKKNSAIK